MGGARAYVPKAIRERATVKVLQKKLQKKAKLQQLQAARLQQLQAAKEAPACEKEVLQEALACCRRRQSSTACATPSTPQRT
jgi:hypothetical protein